MLIAFKILSDFDFRALIDPEFSAMVDSLALPHLVEAAAVYSVGMIQGAATPIGMAVGEVVAMGAVLGSVD